MTDDTPRPDPRDDDRPRSRRRDRDDDLDDDLPRSRRRDRDEDLDDADDRPRRRRRPPPPDPMDDPAMRFVLPVNTSFLAIAAGYAGLFSVLCLPAPLALLLGIMALVQLKKNPKLHGHGRAIFGIVMGAGCTLLATVLIIMAALEHK